MDLYPGASAESADGTHGEVVDMLGSRHHVVGHVTALGLDAEHVITDPVVDGGHPWAHREITLPIGDVLSLATDLVQLGVAGAAVGTYPLVRFHGHHHAALPAPPPRTDERLTAAVSGCRR